MDEQNELGYEDFFGAFGDDGGTQPPEEAPTDAEETDTQQEQTDGAPDQPGEEAGAEADAPEEPGGGSPEETFTLKVNKQEQTVTRAEMIALAQKGADYDRVKAVAEQAKSDNEALRKSNGEMQPVYDLLTQIAAEAKVSVQEYLDTLRLNRLMEQEGLSKETAQERLARQKAEQELEALRAASQKPVETEPTGKERAAKDLADFRKEYPDVELTQELMDKLLPGIQEGKSMTEAYRKLESDSKDAQIQRLAAELEAAKQNKKNRAASPGSQRDDGASRSKSEFDDFWAAFN